MTFSEVFQKGTILMNIPVTEGKYLFSPSLMSSIILMQVACSKKFKEFDDFMREALGKLKKEGFEKRAQKISQINDIEKRLHEHDNWDGKGERPVKPTEEELKELENSKQLKEEYSKEIDDLQQAYSKVYQDKLQEEISDMKLGFSRHEYEDLVKVIGVTGDINFRSIDKKEIKVHKIDFLKSIGELFVQM